MKGRISTTIFLFLVCILLGFLVVTRTLDDFRMFRVAKSPSVTVGEITDTRTRVERQKGNKPDKKYYYADVRYYVGDQLFEKKSVEIGYGRYVGESIDLYYNSDYPETVYSKEPTYSDIMSNATINLLMYCVLGVCLFFLKKDICGELVYSGNGKYKIVNKSKQRRQTDESTGRSHNGSISQVPAEQFNNKRNTEEESAPWEK